MADVITSRRLYHYLCEKVGTENIVKARRTFFKVCDCSKNCSGQSLEEITSGSKAEGLDLPGSDLDIMLIDETNIIRTECSYTRPSLRNDYELYMITDNTPPGFVRIMVRSPACSINNRYIHICGIAVELVKTENGIILPNTSLKTVVMDSLRSTLFYVVHPGVSHGPCSSTKDGAFDFMFCIRLDEWPHEALEWITRPRVHDWPREDLITDIFNHDNSVLLVPIGSKFGAPEDNPQEWRISFSVPEQKLVYSFNHTQILCYAILKILLKQVIDKEEGAGNLLCSYFLKTVLFWLIEETGVSLWNPDNLLKCIWACLKRLLYHIQLGYFPNYFIRKNNMFEGKIIGKSKTKLHCILHNIYIEGIRCFLRTETLKDFITPQQTYPISEIEWGQYDEDKAVYPLLKYFFTSVNSTCPLSKIFFYISAIKSNFIKSLFALFFSSRCIQTAVISKYNLNVSNKHCYRQYKFLLPYILLGSHFNINAWLLLATFFYQHKQYHNTLSITNFVCSEASKNPNIIHQFEIKPSQYSFNKAGSFLQRYKASCVIPLPICSPDGSVVSNCNFDIYRDLHDLLVMDREKIKLFDESLCRLGHFMRFMCFHNLHNFSGRHKALCDLQQVIDQTDVTRNSSLFLVYSLLYLFRAYEISNTEIPFRNFVKLKDIWLLALDNPLFSDIADLKPILSDLLEQE